MKESILSIFFISIFSFVLGQDEKELMGIIDLVNNRINEIKIASYNFDEIYIDPTKDDSIKHTVGSCSYIKVQSDTIFGAKFHTKSTNYLGNFEYYYDGRFGYEYLHFMDKLILFDPLMFDNNPNNPAKVRISRAPMIDELIDNSFPRNLVDSVFDIKLEDLNKTYRISFYSKPIEDYKEIHLTIDKSTYDIISIEMSYEYIGIRLTRNRKIYYTKINDSEIIDEIVYKNTHSNYTIEEFKGYKTLDSERESDLEGTIAPYFNGLSFQGELISYKDIREKYVLLDFWEPWCGACISAFPQITKINNKYSDKGLTVIGLVSVNISSAEKIVSSKKIDYTNIIVDKSIHEIYGIRAFPTYVLISPEGKILKLTEGNLDGVKYELNKLFRN